MLEQDIALRYQRKPDLDIGPELPDLTKYYHYHEITPFVRIRTESCLSSESDIQERGTWNFSLNIEQLHDAVENAEFCGNAAQAIIQKFAGQSFASFEAELYETDLDDWIKVGYRYLGIIEDSGKPQFDEAHTEVYQSLDRFFEEDSNRFGIFLVGMCIINSVNRYNWNLVEDRDRKDRFDVIIEESFLLNEILTEAIKSEKPSHRGAEICRGIIFSDNGEEFLEYVKKLCSFVGIPTISTEFFINEDDEDIDIYTIDKDIHHFKTPLPETDFGLFAIEGLDGSGKSTIVEETGVNFFYAAHLLLPETLAFLNSIGGEKLVEKVKIRAKKMIEALERGDIGMYQELIVEARHDMGEGRNVYLGTCSDRCFLTNPVYSKNGIEAFNKIRKEFSKKTVFPMAIYFMNTPLSICLNRISNRESQDIWDQSKVETFVSRLYLYRLFARKFPSLIKQINTCDNYGLVKSPREIVEGLHLF